MGTWGAGLYSSDMAADLRAYARQVLLLPWDIEQIVDLVLEDHEEIWSNRDDPDSLAFWLVLADLIRASGDHSHRVLKKAIEIIDGGLDLEACERHDMSAQGLRKRSKVLTSLKERLVKDKREPSRKTLSKPKPQLVSVGAMITVPVDSDGMPPNPYFPADELAKRFKPVSERSCIIVEVGMAHGFFPWYRPLVQLLDQGHPADQWITMLPGTLSKQHLRKMRATVAEGAPLSREWLHSMSAHWPAGDLFAINDCSLCGSFLTPDYVILPPMNWRDAVCTSLDWQA